MLDLLALLETLRTATWERAVRSTAHELGTPVNVVMGHAELLAEEGASKQSVESIANQARGITQSLQDAVSYADGKPPDGSASATFEAVVPAVRELVQSDAELVLEARGNSGLSKEEVFLVLLAFARFCLSRASSGDEVSLRAEGGQQARVRIECPVGRVDEKSVRQLAEPWFAGGARDGLELAIALWIVRRAGGQTRLERDGSRLVLESTWPVTR